MCDPLASCELHTLGDLLASCELHTLGDRLASCELHTLGDRLASYELHTLGDLLASVPAVPSSLQFCSCSIAYSLSTVYLYIGKHYVIYYLRAVVQHSVYRIAVRKDPGCCRPREGGG